MGISGNYKISTDRLLKFAVSAYFVAIICGRIWRGTWPESFGLFFAKEKSGAEILTFLLFAAAGIAAFIAGVKQKSPGFFLYSFFCLFIAGEDIQWGRLYFQELLPGVFLDTLPLRKR